jgi:hypothetical protein
VGEHPGDDRGANLLPSAMFLLDIGTTYELGQHPDSPQQILTFYLFADPITKRPHDQSSPASLTGDNSEGRSELKIIIGIGSCIIGAVIRAAALVGASVIINPTVLCLGVILGGE